MGDVDVADQGAARPSARRVGVRVERILRGLRMSRFVVILQPER